jgi:outer membrane receptor for monomeric catechols
MTECVAAKAFVAMSCVAFISAPAFAEDGVTATQTDVQAARDIVVTGARGLRVESPKTTSPLLDTPQTVTIISDQVLRRLWRLDQPARLFRQQRCHRRWRPRQRPI